MEMTTFDFGNVCIGTVEDDEKGHYIPLATLRAAHEGWLPNYMKGPG